MKVIAEAIAQGFWPKAKEVTSQNGERELEENGFKLFYIGKNADLYFIHGKIPYVLMLRSNRTSVFDIPLDLEIEGKGKIQTKISNLGFDFAERFGIKTSRQRLFVDLHFQEVSQVHEMCRPLEGKIGKNTYQFEFIFRNYLTGSLFKMYQEGKDKYGLKLPEGMKKWEKMPDGKKFTPTTKGVKDEPLNSDKVRNIFPKIISKLEELFDAYTKHCEERGIIMIDTKFEVFIDSKGDWVLGDEVFTPESSRFILKESFNKGIYKSMDKQILRDFAKEMFWKDQYQICCKKGYLKPGERFKVYCPDEIKTKILNGYNKIYKMLS